jgi:hypothetical protein
MVTTPGVVAAPMAVMTEMVPAPKAVSGDVAGRRHVVSKVMMFPMMPPETREGAVVPAELVLFGMMAPGAVVVARVVPAVAVVKRDLDDIADASAQAIRGLGGRRHGERERQQRRADP